jgi:hypothetical protein
MTGTTRGGPTSSGPRVGAGQAYDHAVDPVTYRLLDRIGLALTIVCAGLGLWALLSLFV